MDEEYGQKDITALIAYLAVCITWGTTYLVIRIGVQKFPPEMFGGIRFFISGLIILFFALITNNWLTLSIKDTIKIMIAGLFMLLGGHGMVVFAEQWVHSGVAALMLSIGPLMMAIVEMIVYRKRTIGIMGWVGLLLGFAGVTMLILSGKGLGNIDLKGGMILFFASIFFAIGSVFSKKYKPEFINFNTKPKVDAPLKKNYMLSSMLTQLSIQMMAGGIGMIIVGAIMGEIPKMEYSFTVVWTMIYLIIFGGIIGYGSYFYVLQKWPAAKAGTYSYINTVIAVIAGAIFLGEPITVGILVSMIIIMVSVFMVQKSKV